jgi:hypothetical protein
MNQVPMALSGVRFELGGRSHDAEYPRPTFWWDAPVRRRADDRVQVAAERLGDEPSLTSVSAGQRCDDRRMTAWQDVEQAAPEFARRVRTLFDAHRHKTLATVRADGSPRISGIETVFEDGELVFGSMPGARKGADLRRDPRFALHSATVDPIEGAERNGRARRRSPVGRSLLDRSPMDPTATASTPTSPRSCTPT